LAGRATEKGLTDDHTILTWRIEPDQTPPATRRGKSAPKSLYTCASDTLGRLLTDVPAKVIHDSGALSA